MRHSKVEHNVLGTETKSFLTMHNNLSPKDKRFKKHTEISCNMWLLTILGTWIDFGTGTDFASE